MFQSFEPIIPVFTLEMIISHCQNENMSEVKYVPSMFQAFKLKVTVFTLEMTILNNFTLSQLKHFRSEIGPFYVSNI